MKRSSQKTSDKLIKALNKKFEGKITSPMGTISMMLEEALQKVDKEFFHIQFTPYINNQWSIYFMYGTRMSLTAVELEELDCLEGFTKHVTEIGQNLLKEIEINKAEQAKRQLQGLMDKWVELDLVDIREEVDVLKGDESKQAELSQARKRWRKMREVSFDFDDVVLAHIQLPTLSEKLEPVQAWLPKACEQALLYAEQFQQKQVA